MAKPPIKKPAPAPDFKTEATHISVKFPGLRQRWRAGRKFTAEPTVIAKDALSDDEKQAILGDKALVVTEVTPPAADGKSAPAPDGK